MEAQCYVDGCHRPLMSKGYWTEKDKKQLPPSPTLMYAEPWPSDDDDDEKDERNDNKRHTRQGYKESRDLLKQGHRRRRGRR